MSRMRPPGRPSAPPPTELQRLNAVRAQAELGPLADDATLDLELQRAGITHCFGKPYAWAVPR